MAEQMIEPSGPRRPAFASAALPTLGTYVGVATLSFGNVLIMARALGPAGRGEVAFLTTIAVLTANVALLGIEEANVNLAGRESRLKAALAANSLVLSAVFGIGAVGVAAGLVAAFPSIGGDVPSGLRWLALGAIPVLILQTYLQALAQADYRFALMNATLLLPAVASVATNGVLAGVGRLSVLTVMVTWVAAQTASTAILVWRVLRSTACLVPPDVALARRSFVFGLKTHPGRVMNLANFRLDQWILAGLAGSRELGLYSVAVSWAETLFFLPTALATVQRPDLVRGDREHATRRAATVFRACVIVTILLTALLILLAPFLCATVFGDEFRGSIDDLRVLALGGVGMAALKLLGDALIAQRRPLLTSAAVGAAFAATVVLDVVLIPRYGGLGAAVASSVAYTAGGIAAAFFFARVLRGRFRELVPRRADLGRVWHQVRVGLGRRSGAVKD